jgi:hypothetical protein
VGLPCRTLFPFFDVRLAAHVWRSLHFPWRADKQLLRAAMRERLPREVLRRAKTPLYTPALHPRTDDPLYRLALLPEARRFRVKLLSGERIGDYVDVARARSLVESPLPRGNAPLDNCFPLAHWLHAMTDRPDFSPPTKELRDEPATAG